MSNKKFMIKAVVKSTGESVQSFTDNVEQRLEMLKYNIKSINGEGTAIFERFDKFIGSDLKDVEFEIYELQHIIDGSTI